MNAVNILALKERHKNTTLLDLLPFELQSSENAFFCYFLPKNKSIAMLFIDFLAKTIKKIQISANYFQRVTSLFLYRTFGAFFYYFLKSLGLHPMICRTFGAE